MSSEDQEFSRKRFVWARGAFELEGLVAALGCWVVGILLGMLWAPLFWIGFLGAVVCLMAGRRAGRTPPEVADAVCAPVDGVVQRIEILAPPSELRLGANVMTRVRVASSPAATNIIYAPLSGGIETLVTEEGDPSRVIASEPDAVGLACVFVAMTSPDGPVGLRIATGGFGPRLDMEVEARDAVRLGRRIGKRRLGGWCDIYLPAAFGLALRPGMTLVGGETTLGTWAHRSEANRTIEAMAKTLQTDEADIFEDGDQDERPDPSENEPDSAEAASDYEEKLTDPAEMFARLRREASKRDD